MAYAKNTPFAVIRVQEGNVYEYYCCEGGVWFHAENPYGPWSVSTAVPAVIYTLPPSCPHYSVTYVRVYHVSPTVGSWKEKSKRSPGGLESDHRSRSRGSQRSRASGPSRVGRTGRRR